MYAYPAGAYFCSCKSRQNTLGAVPQDPLTLKLRLDTNDALASSVQRRRYALKVPAVHFYVEIVDRVPLPRSGGGGRCARGYLWSASVRSTDLDFSSQKNLNPYPAQLSVKRDCQGGSSVPLDRILVPFVRTKGTPRRRAVPVLHPAKSMPRR